MTQESGQEIMDDINCVLQYELKFKINYIFCNTGFIPFVKKINLTIILDKVNFKWLFKILFMFKSHIFCLIQY